MQPRGLVIDLRGNGGGTHVSGRIAAHLFDERIETGMFVYPSVSFADVIQIMLAFHGEECPLGREKPLASQHGNIARIGLDSLGEHALIEETSGNKITLDAPDLEGVLRLMWEMRKYGAFVGFVEPAEPYYAGPVVALVDSGSASATEILLALLQDTKRATLVGENSAGKVLGISAVELQQGWRLYVPVADYYTMQGVRLEGNGVKPDHRVTSKNALRAALRFLGTPG